MHECSSPLASDVLRRRHCKGGQPTARTSCTSECVCDGCPTATPPDKEGRNAPIACLLLSATGCGSLPRSVAHNQSRRRQTRHGKSTPQCSECHNPPSDRSAQRCGKNGQPPDATGCAEPAPPEWRGKPAPFHGAATHERAVSQGSGGWAQPSPPRTPPNEADRHTFPMARCGAHRIDSYAVAQDGLTLPSHRRLRQCIPTSGAPRQ